MGVRVQAAFEQGSSQMACTTAGISRANPAQLRTLRVNLVSRFGTLGDVGPRLTHACTLQTLL